MSFPKKAREGGGIAQSPCLLLFGSLTVIAICVGSAIFNGGSQYNVDQLLSLNPSSVSRVTNTDSSSSPSGCQEAQQVTQKIDYGKCHSSQFVNVTTPLFVVWEDYEKAPPFDWYVIQAGGNVGLNVGGGDPVWEYVRPCRWRGLVLEPQPQVFQQLERNYADVPDIHTLNLAVSDQSGFMSMRGAGETASLNPNSKDGDVQVVTLPELWEKYKPERVDVLVVDIEGNEENVLFKAPIPSPKPRYILFEMIHLKPEVKDRIDQALYSQGYVRRDDLKHMDKTARSRNAPPQDRLYSLLPKGPPAFAEDA